MPTAWSAYCYIMFEWHSPCIGGNRSVLVVAGVVMNFTNILPQRLNDKRYSEYHGNYMNYCKQ